MSRSTRCLTVLFHTFCCYFFIFICLFILLFCVVKYIWFDLIWFETDRQTHRQTDRHTDRQTDTQTDRQTHRQTDTQTDRQTHTHTQTDKQTDRHTDRQTDRRRISQYLRNFVDGNKINESENVLRHFWLSFYYIFVQQYWKYPDPGSPPISNHCIHAHDGYSSVR